MRDGELTRGGAVFGAAMAAFGAMCLARLDVVPGIEPLPDGVPAGVRAIVAVLTGVVLVAAGAGLVLGWRRRAAALTAAAVLTLWLVVLHGPRLALHLTSGTVWVPACEVAALGAGAWVLVAALDGRDLPAMRVVFGATFLLFALSHALYLGYVISVIPAWLPAPRFWAVGAGVAHLAAGLSLVSGVRARLASTLLAVMFGAWVVMLHAPRVVANAGRPNEWSSLFVALGMCGASWIVAATLAPAPLARGAADAVRAPEPPALAAR